MSLPITIKPAQEVHLDELEILYDELNDYLADNLNYPGWLKGIYPTRDTAVAALRENSLFLALIDGRIAGSIVLNHEPEDAYSQVKWLIEADYNEVLIVRTLVIHPLFLKHHVATHLLEFARQYAVTEKLKSIRLDVSAYNLPAIRLYAKMGYKHVATIDLGLPYEHLKWFDVYELVL